MNEIWMKKEQGLTLIEVIISIAIMGIIAVPLISLFFSSVETSLNSKDQMQAAMLAQKEIESIKGNDFLEFSNKYKEEFDENGNFKITSEKNEGVFKIITTIKGEEFFRFFEIWTMKIEFKNNQTTVYAYNRNGQSFKKTSFNNHSMDILKIKKEINYSQNGYQLSLYDDNNNLISDTTIEVTDTMPINIKIEINDENIFSKIIAENDCSLNPSNSQLQNQNSPLTLYIFRQNLSNNDYRQIEIEKKGNVALYDKLHLGYYPYRLYKVEVTIKKNDKILENLEGYKTFLKRDVDNDA